MKCIICEKKLECYCGAMLLCCNGFPRGFIFINRVVHVCSQVCFYELNTMYKLVYPPKFSTELNIFFKCRGITMENHIKNIETAMNLFGRDWTRENNHPINYIRRLSKDGESDNYCEFMEKYFPDEYCLNLMKILDKSTREES